MNAPCPRPLDYDKPDGPEFFVGTALEVEAIVDAARELHQSATELNAHHRAKGPVELKLAAEKAARLAGQVHSLSSHLARMATLHINRNTRT